MSTTTTGAPRLDQRTIYGTWWPLAVSWIFMSLELPAVAAVMARLPNPELSLAAYGGIVFPISLLVEAPVIMMLAASTAVCKTYASYLKLRRFMFGLAAALTAVHALIAFTPLYDVIVDRVLGLPEEIRGPGRVGLMIMTPWTAAIAVRRFLQGVLIRFGHSKGVGVGTAIRLAANLVVLLGGLGLGATNGVVVGTTAVIAGVFAEMFFVMARAKRVIDGPLRDAVADDEPWTTPSLAAFYVPLAITPVLSLMSQPVISGALSRMPNPIESLAILPVINGVSFGLRSLGIAFHEVAVALMDRPGAGTELPKFARRLGLFATALIVAFAATPAARAWFGGFTGLSPELTAIAALAIWIYVPSPAFSVLHNWRQGVLVAARETRPVTEAVGVYLVVTAALLAVGIWGQFGTGIYVSAASVTIANLALASWVTMRSRPARSRLPN